MAKPWLFLSPLLLATAIFAGDAGAAETSLALAEVAEPPASSGVAQATLRTAAEGELRGVDASRLKKRRSILVSMAVVGATHSPYACTVNAMLRDAKTGSMLAIIEGRARAEGEANAETRNQVLRAAVRIAMSQIPDALAASK